MNHFMTQGIPGRPLPSNQSSDFFDEARRELCHARKKFGPVHNAHEGYAVILEEVRELEAEVFRRDKDLPALRDELVQIAAMCGRLAEDVVDAGVPREGE